MADWYVVLALSAFLIFIFGALFGQFMTNKRWQSNANNPQRLSCGNRLYKVKDVTPLDEDEK